jgi:hypothetical protein
MKPGNIVNDIRHSENYIKDNPERIDELNKLGFDWDPLETMWQRFFSALNTYVDVNGNPHVPRWFKVPSEALWPKELWGLNLGSIVSDIRSKEYYIKDKPERIELLRALGFRFKTVA